MAVRAIIQRHGAAESEWHYIAGSKDWNQHWLPAATALGLDLIPRLGDGYFTTVFDSDLSRIVSQLHLLRGWMVEIDDKQRASVLEELLTALTRLNLEVDKVSFG